MQNLKNLRKNNNISLMSLAKSVEISHQMISNYELGKVNPPVDALFKIADFFGCSIDYLLGHQTQNTLQLEGLSETQLKLVDMIKILTPEQAYFALGYFSDMLKIPYSQVRPTRPF